MNLKTVSHLLYIKFDNIKSYMLFAQLNMKTKITVLWSIWSVYWNNISDSNKYLSFESIFNEILSLLSFTQTNSENTNQTFCLCYLLFYSPPRAFSSLYKICNTWTNPWTLDFQWNSLYQTKQIILPWFCCKSSFFTHVLIWRFCSPGWNDL